MDLVGAVREAGVIGAGGAGFPTHVKLAAAAETVIVNGAECEPLLRVDQELMAAHAPALVTGLAAVLAATGGGRGVFALKGKYHRAVDALRRAVGGRADMDLALLEDFYPAGDEHVLVREVTGRAVPPGGIPPHVGAVVVNVETLLNIALAAAGTPVTRKYVTVAGAVAHPGTFSVPVGIPLGELLALAGGATAPVHGLIEGGPLMGVAADPADPVTKTTKGLLVLPDSHPCLVSRRVTLAAQVRRAAAACCTCRMCTDLCPRHLLGHALEPHRSLNAVAYGRIAPSSSLTQAFLCSECGLCEAYACPMGLSPRRLHAEIKRELAAAGVENPHRGREASPRPEMSWRRVPARRLLARLGLASFAKDAPLTPCDPRPVRVRIPLRQGVGAAASPVVKTGDYVRRGQCIAEPPPGRPGCRHHASIDGRITGINDAIEIEAL